VSKISPMVSLPRSDEANRLLQRLAKDCAPLMTRRNWTVRDLREFMPENKGLLGLNANKGDSFR
jgi:WLM domain